VIILRAEQAREICAFYNQYLSHKRGKKGKVHPRTSHEDPEEM
jgi:hypothetical protein